MKNFALRICMSFIIFVFEISSFWGIVLFLIVLFKDVLTYAFKCTFRLFIVIALQKRSHNKSLSRAVKLSAQITDLDRKEN